MRSSKQLLALLLFVSLSTCKADSQTERLHKQAFNKQEQVIEYINEIHLLLAADTIQKKQFITVLQELEEGLFPIPGFTLSLPGHEGHDDGHNRPALSAKEILAVQVDLLRQVKRIKSDIINAR